MTTHPNATGQPDRKPSHPALVLFALAMGGLLIWAIAVIDARRAAAPEPAIA